MVKPFGTIKITDQEFRSLTAHVKERYGIDLSQKRVLIEGRMTNVLRERGMSNFSQYLKVLFADKSGKEATIMLNRLTTNHSFFMREPEHFEFLRTTALPDLMRRHPNHSLCIWSAGCSAGQEAYTIAMTIQEALGVQKNLWDTRILATDISMNVLDRARQGIYPADNIKDLPATWRRRYFNTLPDGQVQLCNEIRSQVIFRPMNLMEPFSLKQPMDLIFCRNVMIYFDTPTKEDLVARFYQATAPGGYLFIGHSESISRERTLYKYLCPAIYQRGVER